MKKNTKLLFNSFLVTLLLFITQVFAQGNEDFTNLPSDPGAASSYLNRSWLGTDNVTWTGNGRKDRNINGAGNPAICMGGTNQSAAGYILSPTYSGGIGTLTFTTVRDFTSTNPRTDTSTDTTTDTSTNTTKDTATNTRKFTNIHKNTYNRVVSRNTLDRPSACNAYRFSVSRLGRYCTQALAHNSL